MSFSAVTNAVHAAIEGLAALLGPATGSFAVALAIVVFTVLVRLLISPLSYLQARGQRRAQALAPQLEKLREKHREDPARMLSESFALQRANGAGLLVTLLPALAQAPFFMIMYRVALDPPAGVLFGAPLTAHLWAALPIYAVLIAVALLLARWTARRMTALRFLPYLTVPVIAWLPLAGALYLVTSTACTAVEHALWRRPVPTGNR
ncbi:YidC/Oxa1 family membrane protein insertase [Paractinoplanes rishiriensis]|uniref:Membrane protein insertase YidC n=1 Tax=Paractinoplanes rishiriensis TaxID=1050105 RepID=A0A919JVD7_9ACTN|nr:membrane protein insertase YidC [Actinoplanes rishiriensis]GIE93964.1 protein translocase component YidC [Actinoplanes rishiriensis]